MMARIKKIKSDGHDALLFICPGCGRRHILDDRWSFNNSFDRPTLNPSILGEETAEEPGTDTAWRCHSYVVAGQIRFLSDCTHELRGQTVDLPEMK